MKIVFMLEEPSMKYLLDELLPKILPSYIAYQTIPHNGRNALRRSLLNKLRGWNEPEARFVVVHDQDAQDCVELKNSLSLFCAQSKRNVLIRIACQELESWYFGDLNAVAKAYGKEKMVFISEKKQFRNPDSIQNPKEALRELLPEHQQIAGAKLIAQFMDINSNTSASFNCFVSGVQRFAGLR